MTRRSKAWRKIMSQERLIEESKKKVGHTPVKKTKPRKRISRAR